MYADMFRHFLEYHLSENRKLWEAHILPLTQAQFEQPAAYSVGSVRNQVVHMMEADDIWFSELRGKTEPTYPLPDDINDRVVIRQNWDRVEAMMRVYLAALRDDMLFQRPIVFEEDRHITVGQALLHVANHGTDHRAQLLRQLNDMGAITTGQDYIFYVNERR